MTGVPEPVDTAKVRESCHAWCWEVMIHGTGEPCSPCVELLVMAEEVDRLRAALGRVRDLAYQHNGHPNHCVALLAKSGTCGCEAWLYLAALNSETIP